MRPYPINRVSIVMTVHNEQSRLLDVLQHIDLVCRQLPYDYEIILIDDGSRDDTAHILEQATLQEDSKLVAVVLNRHYGQHSAIMAGFEQCTGEVIVTLDASLRNTAQAIPRLVAQAALGYDLVASMRYNRQDSIIRRCASRLINAAIRRGTGVVLNDNANMLRAYHRSVVDAMLSCRERSTFVSVLANRFARHTVEIPVNHTDWQDDDSSLSPMRLLGRMFDVITCMTTTPLRLLSIAGLSMAALGIVIAISLMMLRFVVGTGLAGHETYLLFAVFFIFSGGQLIGWGLLGEYLGRMYTDVRARPRFLLKGSGAPHSPAN